jgi:DNA-directed RNA polymerase subunit beta
MPNIGASNYRIRRSYRKIRKILDIPNLIDIQKRSYDRFLQATVPSAERENIGLQAVFQSVFPIRDFNGTADLVFKGYAIEKPKYEPDECRQRGTTYAAPIKVNVELALFDPPAAPGQQRQLRYTKEQEVYFGEIPLMTDKGTFIINGTERVVVTQLHRSPGVIFDDDKGKSHASSKILYSARIIPGRGSWLDIEFDHKDVLYVRIDRRKKLPVTVLLKALNYTDEQLLEMFYRTERIRIDGEQLLRMASYDVLRGQRAARTLKFGPRKNDVLQKGEKFTFSVIERLKELGIKELPMAPEELVGGANLPAKVSAHDVFDPNTGEVLLECNEELTQEHLELLKTAGISEFDVLFIDNVTVGSYLRDTLKMDKTRSADEAKLKIHRRFRAQDQVSLETARQDFDNLFFNPERYDLTRVGRLKLNNKFAFKTPLDKATLTKEDIVETVRHLIELKERRGKTDDIDHLGNRRVRAVGELLENQYRVGLQRMERAIKERMSMNPEIESAEPHDLINPKPVAAVVKEYFGSSQLSQFMDQTNALSEVTHKRRLSALGPGGLTRERAGFEVRDVHATHYGRICPIETPEGPNIGLIASLSTYARVNEFGFVETPFRRVAGGKVTDDVRFYHADEEKNQHIAQANAEIDPKGRLVGPLVSARLNGEYVMVAPEKITLMDVSPIQLVSVAAALIPFLEHDDANRALMGSNMQRQAVPLLKAAAPLVGTGLEGKVAVDSGVMQIARRAGIVESVDAARIVVRAEADGSEIPDIYTLEKFRRSNQATCINQRPIVKEGDRVREGEVIADGFSTDLGELALGRDVLVAYMTWSGYNFEDSILISERLVHDDEFTSIHIEEFECVARDTKLGKEEITRDIPNLGEEALRNLDESGIVRIGAEVQHGDILVGKITPKGETQLSPEEKLLRAIFGEKASDVRDTSLRVPPGVSGIVINARVYSRRGMEKDERMKSIEDQERARLEKDRNDEIAIIRESALKEIRRLLHGRTTGARLIDDKGKTLLAKDKKLTADDLESVPRKYWSEVVVQDENTAGKVAAIKDRVADQEHSINEYFAERIEKLTRGDDLPPGVNKTVKVYVAIKRKVSVGDKMAGRHGNKGVISRILPVEDMPYLADGTPVDMVLNPLGVPSRMNVGQILETHLGWAARRLGQQVAEVVRVSGGNAAAVRPLLKKVFSGDADTRARLDAMDDEMLIAFAQHVDLGIFVECPVFDSAKEEEIRDLLKLSDFPENGQTVLFDGRSGETFDSNVTVGIHYVMKLHHLVDEKIHARSIGPYSLVTQQPLGGKAQFGGQRLGEMEVWAMEAYGAAHALQEFLTVKSDDTAGRTRMYESIVRGDQTLEAGVPESFNVLVRELQSLCLNFELLEDETAQPVAAPGATPPAA